ncbi:MAG: type IV pilus modification protein PilV [Gammaproteobacteria bacterium]|jgi:type IV pilus assembly protein PilV
MPISRSKQAGFSLIEALIAVLVVAIGLLGLAGMQTLALSNNYTSYMRSIAQMDVENLAAMMRSNMPGVQALDYANKSSESPLPSGTTAIPTSAPTDCTTTNCTIGDMASYDLANISQMIQQDLPQGTITVLCNDAACTATSGYTVSVSWTEADRTTVTSQAGTSGTQTFTTVIYP